MRFICTQSYIVRDPRHNWFTAAVTLQTARHFGAVQSCQPQPLPRTCVHYSHTSAARQRQPWRCLGRNGTDWCYSLKAMSLSVGRVTIVISVGSGRGYYRTFWGI
eukprot:scaffold241675_cov17-Prasinocladus_malaysianus.AAC.1